VTASWRSKPIQKKKNSGGILTFICSLTLFAAAPDTEPQAAQRLQRPT